ncbi:MAG: hypothetical protein EA349_10715 [Halomonadaceae bacterium]|nr:MAG: hypothetical protein EA349_10715 [Halomonadaceae bacterium]
MSDTTEQVLWQGWQQAGGYHLTRLTCRPGRGRATYHRHDPGAHHHEIVYGTHMVADKADPGHCAGWLSTREIRQRGYWQGEVSMLNLLAHTCCHEFAHLQQSLTGVRRRGQVHTPRFYQLLDDLHQCGAADTVRDTLFELARARQLPLSATPHTLPAEPRERLAAYAPGDAVLFGQAPDVRTGQVIRVNRKTCTVMGTGRHRGLRFRVPPGLLWHQEAG